MAGSSLAAILLLGVALAAPAMAADQPGQKFHLRVSDLPKPYDTVAVDDTNLVIPRPEGRIPQAPAGFEVSLFADLKNSRWMAVAPNGDVFVSQPRTGNIIILRDSKGSGHADQTFTYLTGLARFQGVAFNRGYFYYSDINAIWRVPYKDGDTAPGGKPEKVTAAANLRSEGMHPSRNFAFGPDGTLYMSMGSHDNVSDFRPGAEIFKVAANGELVTYASGIRNPVGLTFQPGTGTLYASVNERDGLGDKLPPDYFTSVKPGGFYGYPYSYTGKNPDPNWGSRDPGGKIASAIMPDVLFPAHSAPIGLTFYTGTSFPRDYQGDAFVSLHGSWDTSEPTGYKVVRIHFVNGKPDGGYENFVTGFRDDNGVKGEPARAWGKPSGLAIAKDGALLIADDTGGPIWRVQYKGK
jgi:glucose/arabinose dehydrogenase